MNRSGPSNGQAALHAAVEALEQAIAARDAALELLRALCEIITRERGWLRHEDQVTLRAACAFLAEVGR